MPAYQRAGGGLPDRSWLKLQADHRFEIVAIAASAGGLAVLSSIVETLPADLPVPVLITQHRSRCLGYLERLLGRNARLRVRQAGPKERLEAGNIYVAPGGCHTTVGRGGTVVVTEGMPIAFVTPSADLLFGSLAEVYGRRAIACVLTGMGADGAAGVTKLRKRGGFVIAQRPGSAAYPGMPASAIETRKVDLVLDAQDIGFALCTLADRTRTLQ